MLVDPFGLVLICCICGLIGFAIGWCGGSVDAIQRRREFDKQQRALGVTTGAAAQLGPSTAADEWRAPAAGVPTGFAPQPAAWANESGLERIEKARTGYVESPLLTVNAKQTDLFTVPLYRHPPYGVKEGDDA